jgi:hypothetical protein
MEKISKQLKIFSIEIWQNDDAILPLDCLFFNRKSATATAIIAATNAAFNRRQSKL